MSVVFHSGRSVNSVVHSLCSQKRGLHQLVRKFSPGPCIISNANLSTSITHQSSEAHPLNSSIIPNFVNNRNPRNLEKLRIAEKAQGWGLEKPEHSYWHKLTLELTGKHITARIVHVFGKIPITASTNEWCIKKHLYSTKDLTAAKAIGKILAHRCLQSGITEIACFIPEEERKKEKIALILQTIENEGVSLDEPSQVYIPWALNYPTFPEKPWEVLEEDEVAIKAFDKVQEAAKVLDVLEKVKIKDKDKLKPKTK